MREQSDLAVELLSLHGKLRRATDPQVREAVKARIDALVAQLHGADRTEPCRGPDAGMPKRADVRS